MKQLLLLLFAVVLYGNLQAQQKLPDSAFSCGIFHASYSYEIPGGDLADRFGPNSAVGGGFGYKTSKNWLYTINAHYLFSDNVNEDDIFRNIETSEAYLIDEGGTFAEIYLYERGWNMSVQFGKIFPIKGSNLNSGITVKGGVNFLRHKIRIENPGNNAPQVQGDYRLGYDRLTHGFGFSQFIGYTLMGRSKIYNFYGGFEITEAWTQAARDYQFDLMGKDNLKRLDLIYAVKVGWILPFKKRTTQMFYYY